MQLRTRGHDYELPTVKYDFNKRNFIVMVFCLLYLQCVLGRPAIIFTKFKKNAYYLPTFPEQNYNYN